MSFGSVKCISDGMKTRLQLDDSLRISAADGQLCQGKVSEVGTASELLHAVAANCFVKK